MRAIYQDTPLEVSEKSSAGYRLKTQDGEILVKAELVLEIPEGAFEEVSGELVNLDEKRKELQERKKKLDATYLLKIEAYQKEEKRIWFQKEAIIHHLKERALGLRQTPPKC